MISRIETFPREDQGRWNIKSLKEIAKVINSSTIIISVLSYLIGKSSIMEGLTPFGIAFVTAYLIKYGGLSLVPIFASLGIVTVHGLESYQYLSALWFVFFTYKILNPKFKDSAIKSSVFAASVLMIFKSIYVIINDFYIYDLMLTMFEGIVVFTLTYIFAYSIPTVDTDFNRVFSNEEVICGSIMLALAVSGLGDMSLFGMSIKNVIGIVIVLLLSYNKGPAIGTVVGITIGVVTSMSQINLPFVISIYGFAGLLSGLFKEVGKIGSCIGFILGSIIMSFYIDGASQTILKNKEIVLAIGIFLIMTKLLKGLSSKVIIGISNRTQIEDAYSNRVKDMTYNRLNEISQVFEELGDTFRRVSDKSKIVEQKDVSNLINEVVDHVCKQCYLCKFCWESDFYTTYGSMFDMLGTIETRGNISTDLMPDIFKKRCTKTDAIAQRLNYLFHIYKLDYKWENKIIESRQLVSQQLEGMSKVIKDLANEIHRDVRFKQDVEKEIYAGLRKSRINVDKVIVTETEREDFEIYLEIRTHNSEDTINKAISIASEIIGIQLANDKYCSSSRYDGKKLKFKLVRANRFGAITKVSRIDKGLIGVSGDNYTFGEKCNNYFAVISDGMGVGHKANQESHITISLLEKFLEAGFDKELALKTINSVLVLKSSEEMLATIDMSIVDLYRGKSQFIKIGSAPTFIKRKDKVQIINSHSLPVGILRDVDIQVYEEELEDGDFIIMVSDGILDANYDEDNKERWMANIIQKIESLNPQTIADDIMDAALDVCEGKANDDMTVLVTKIWKRR
ncbi:stage II sporulation protein E [Proteiniborus ethanoligenes]|uniref:Stage II sporulation protein E n=1 Tax=Proteiniborus ethanoligenes TaxID=415015 RepID=A0A1H3L0D4_9FIRM|nr:stage II sporulation protein E [Proteiniborus ethanoligenes]SDY57418.1 stage II sporulation protein E [Proteiniborus ethanoligenes]